jgi:uncharacterized protein (DUF1778 family)
VATDRGVTNLPIAIKPAQRRAIWAAARAAGERPSAFIRTAALQRAELLRTLPKKATP